MAGDAYNKIKIPGIIGKDGKMTLAEAQAQRDEFAKQQALYPSSMTTRHELTLSEIKEMFPYADVSRIESNIANSYVGMSGGGDFYTDPLKHQPYAQGLPLEDYKKKFFEQPKVYGPSPSRQVGTGLGNQVFQDEMLTYLKGKSKKSAFEEIIDALFTTPEKEQFLIDAGYELTQPGPDYRGVDKVIITRKLSTGEIKTITNSLDELFLKEITVKFKNLLLAKAVLKLKL